MAETPAQIVARQYDRLLYERNAARADVARLTTELAAAKERAERMRKRAAAVVKDIDILVENSRGVIGLHLNGDEAPWTDLLAGGKYEDWLVSVELLRAALTEPTHPQPADTPRPAGRAGAA